MLNAPKENKALDVLKFLASILVAGSHIYQLFPSEATNLFYKQWLFRFCVPLFFLSSGYFFYMTGNKLRTIRRVALLFAVGYVLYLPYILKSSGDGLVSTLVWNAVFGYEHLWYIAATLEGMVVWYAAERLPLISGLFRRIGLPAAVVLLLLGALADEYYALLDNGAVTALAQFLLPYGGPRNVVFFGFPMLMIGGGLARYASALRRIPTPWLAVSLLLSLGISFGECGFLFARLGTNISNDITLFNFWPAIFLFLLSFRVEPSISASFAKRLRKMSEYVYVLHIMLIERLAFYLQLPSMLLLAVVVALCVAAGMLTENLLAAFQSQNSV